MKRGWAFATARTVNACPEYGNRIYAITDGDAPEGTEKLFGIRVGTITQKDQLRSRRQIWTRSAQPWINDFLEIPARETQPDGHVAPVHKE